MEIKRRIAFIIVTLLIFLVAFSASIYLTFVQYRESIDETRVSEQMMLSSLNSRLSAGDYILHPSERAIAQWKVEQDRIKKLAGLNIHLNTAIERDLITKIQNNLSSLNDIFEQLVELNNDTTSTALRQGKEDQLIGELDLKAQELAIFALQLARFNDGEATDFLDYIIILFSSMASLFFIILIGSLWVVWQSITQLDQMRDNAQKERDQLDILMQSIGDGVFAIDRSWNITLWNKMASRLTGWSAEDAIGKPFREIIKFVDRDTKKEKIVFIEEAMLYGQIRHMEDHTILIQKDGQEIPVGDSASPISVNGQVVGCIVVFRDMSKEVEVDQVKEDFTFRIVHDLRAPLTVMKSILGAEEMVKKCGGDPELKENYSLLSEASNHMLAMVNDILTTIKSQKSGTSIKKIAVTDVVKDVARALKPLALNRRINYDYNPTAGLPLVSVPDPDHIREIFSNIFTNAIKYNKDGGLITITHEVDGKFLKTDISDTGAGISKENLGKIFTPYSRVNEREGVQGTGLGLYIVKKLAEEAKGKVEVSSVEGSGTTFSVYLPI